MVRTVAPVLAMGALAAPAHAATPFNLGAGSNPDVKIDAAGRPHVAWLEFRGGTEADPGVVHFCRLSGVGPTACDATAAGGPPGVGNYPHAVHAPLEIFLRGDGASSIVVGCFNCYGGGAQTRELSVSSAGTSIADRAAGAGGGVIGNIRTTGNGAYDGPNRLFYGTDLYHFQLMPPDATPQDNPATTLSPIAGGAGRDAAAGYAGANSPDQIQVAAYLGQVSNEEGTVLRVLTHKGMSGVNTAANWQGGETTVGRANELSMESAASGVSLLTVNNYNGDPSVQYRRFDPVTRAFLAPVTIASAPATGDRFPTMPEIFEAPNRRLYATWEDEGRLRYSTSLDGAAWTIPETVAIADDAHNLHIAGTGAPDQGLLVWDTSGHSDGIVKAAQLTPVLPPRCPGDPRCVVDPVPTSTPTPTPPPQSPPAKVVKRAKLGQFTYSLAVPTQCVPSGGKVAFKFKIAARRKAARRVRIVRIAAAFARRTFARFKKSYATSLPTTGLAKGSRTEVIVKIRYRKRGSKKLRSKTIKAPITICS